MKNGQKTNPVNFQGNIIILKSMIKIISMIPQVLKMNIIISVQKHLLKEMDRLFLLWKLIININRQEVLSVEN